MIIFRHIPYVYLTIITVSAYLHELKHEHDQRPYYISLPSSVALSVSILLYVLQVMSKKLEGCMGISIMRYVSQLL